MGKTTFKNGIESHSLRHRAICDNDTFKGPWRTDIKDAYADAKLHRQKGNELHIIRIVTEQVTSMKYKA